MRGTTYLENRPIDRDIITIGRERTNYLQLDSEDVSRYHAAIIRIPSQDDRKEYFIRDLGSLNFTRVNGKIVHRRLLEDGDSIDIGEFRLQYKKEDLVEKKDEIIRRVTERGIPSTLKDVPTKYAGDDISSSLSPHKRQILYDIQNLIKESTPPWEILETVFDKIRQAIDPEAKGYIASFDKDGDLKPHVKRWDSGKLEINDSVANSLLEGKHYYGKFIVGFPLKIKRKETIGIIYLEKATAEVEFDDEDMNFIKEVTPLITNKISEILSGNKTTKEKSSLEEIFDWPAEMGMIGTNRKIRDIRELINRVASSNLLLDTPVLILGETGTGKELVARAIHFNSPRVNKPFVVVNCAAIPETLLESELFGYAPKSGIAGADPKGKPGMFELGNGGSVFLDEIGDMTLSTQAKVLRIIEYKEFRRLSDTKDRRVDVQFIVATHKNLEKGIEEGEFREDLFYRLGKIKISIPPLRERREDIPLLAHFFLDKYVKMEPSKNIKGISHSAMTLLRQNYDWPGNVRELEGYIKGIIAKIPKERNFIFWDDLPKEIKKTSIIFKDERQSKKEGLDDKKLKEKRMEVEKVEIKKALFESKGNKKKVAELLGMSRPTLYKKIREYGLECERCKKTQSHKGGV
jgi:two-component system response regulator AtoC